MKAMRLCNSSKRDSLFYCLIFTPLVVAEQRCWLWLPVASSIRPAQADRRSKTKQFQLNEHEKRLTLGVINPTSPVHSSHWVQLESKKSRKNEQWIIIILCPQTNGKCERLLIKFEVASVYGYYYYDLYLTLLYWSTGRGMSFYAILTVSAHY